MSSENQAVAEGDVENGSVFAEAAALFLKIDALLKPHGWPAQKMLRDYVELVKRAIAAANVQPKGIEPQISTKHGPWLPSQYEEGETYCQRCLTRNIFADKRACDPHIVQAPAVKAESDDASFEVWEGDELFAGTSGPRAQAWAELLRYAAQCEGVVRVFEVIRVERTLSYVPVQGK